VSRKIAWLLAALLALAACLLFLLLFPASPDQHPSESIVRASDDKSAPVKVQARLDSNRLEDESADALQITVLNTSDQPLTSLHLSILAPGFALDQRNLSCNNEAGVASNNQLPARKNCQFEVSLSPAARSGVYGIVAIVDWNQSNAAGRSTLTLAPITVDQNWGSAKWTLMGRRFGSLMKDLTLPIILALLGAIFAARQSNREADRKKDEGIQEAARTTAQAEQAERQEVQHLLLTRVMELAEQHYLLFVTHCRLILIEADKIQHAKPDAAPDKLFLQVLFLLKRMEVFRLTKGGVFFKTRGAERAAGAAWYLLKSNIYAALGEENAASALKIVKTRWDYASYKAEFPKLAPAWEQFQSWLAEPKNSNTVRGSFWQILGTIDGFQAVMAFESDRALSKYWYEEDGRVDFILPEPTLLFQRASAGPFAGKKTTELETQLHDLYGRPVKVENLP